MNQYYEEVPAIISGKDLDYLSDIYDWNFNLSKLANDFANKVTDVEIKELLKQVAATHKEHAKAVISILE